jgi:hypothetical protein
MKLFARGKRLESYCATVAVLVGFIYAGCANVALRGGSSNAAAPSSLSVTTGGLPSAQTENRYSATLSASGGTPPYIWTLKSGTLPVGLTINAAGLISGVPTRANNYTFAVEVKDSSSPAQSASQSLNIAVSSATEPISISTTSVPTGIAGLAYSVDLSANGGTTPYTWSISAGSLPTGVNLSAGSGTISGTPTASGVFNFTVKVMDATTPTAQTATKSLTITVAPATTVVSIMTISLQNGQQGNAYSVDLSASGGTTPYTWSISAGSLPTGVNLSTGSGTISGTPTASGVFNFTVKVMDATTPAVQTATKPLTITVAAATSPVSITAMSLPNGQLGNGYSVNLAASGGVTPYMWSVSSGALPAGLTLNSSTGAISGTPTISGSYTFNIKVTDSTTPTVQTNTASFIITIAVGTGHSALLSWVASPSLGVVGYNVSRSNISGSGYAKINSSPVSGLTYTDATVVNGMTYYYVLTAVDSSGDESGFSNEIQMVIP